MIALKALKRNFFKSFLIFLSITISIMAVFLISSVSQGVINMYASMIKTDGDIIVTQKGISDTFFSNVDKSLLDKIDAIEGVKSSYAMIVGASPVGKLPIAGIYGTSSKHFSHYKLMKGNYPKKDEVIIGSNIESQVTHNTLDIAGKKFHVSGVFESEIGFEEGGVVMHLDDAGKLFNRSASFLLVEISKQTDIDAIIKVIASLDSEIEVKSTNTFVQEYNQFKIIENSSFVISFLAFLMGLLGIGSVMSMIVNSRKQEFGIMRAVGKSRFFIIKNLFLETTILSLIAYSVALFFSYMILKVLPHIEFLQGYVNGILTPLMAVYVLIATIVMALIGALIPAWFASKTDPVLLINQGNA